MKAPATFWRDVRDVDAELDDVAGGGTPARAYPEADAGRRAGVMDVAGQQGHEWMT